jgi:hypothetical protein
MFWDIQRSAGRIVQDRSANPAAKVINRFDPDRTPVENRLYDNSGNSTGPSTVLQAFLQIGGFPVTPGEDWFITLSAGPKNWAFNTARVNYHSGYPCVVGNFISSVTSGITMSADGQTITGTAASVPGGATHATTNVKYLQGPSNSYSTSNVIPAGAAAALMPYVMVGKGLVAACLSAFGDGTIAEDTTAPDLDGLMCLCNHGEKQFVRTAYSSTMDAVHRTASEQPSYDYNAEFSFFSYALIPSTTSRANTVGAFLAVNTSSVGDSNALYIESDNSPAYKINGLFAGANHGILAWLHTSTHDKTNVDIGSKWANAGKTYTLARCPTTSQVVMAVPVSGGTSDWALDSSNPGSGATYTHISGATHTADIVCTGAASLAQLYPSLQSVERAFLIDGGRFATADGVHLPRQRRIHIDYKIANVKALYEWMWARVGSSDPITYNDPSVASQVRVHLEYMFDAYGVTTVRYENEALQAHTRSFMWPSQHQAITRIPANSETIHFIQPGLNSLASGPTQSGGTPLDFSDWVNMGSNTLEYYAASSAWKAASHWSDNVQRPPRVCAFEVRNSGGTPIKRYVMANSAIKGRTAANNYSTVAHFLSGANKSYMAVAYNEAVSAGDVSSTFGAWGFIDPTFDSQAAISFAFCLGGGEYEWVWYTTGTLSAYAIPTPPQIAGKRLEVFHRTASATVSINGDDATVTTTGKAYIVFRAY